MKNKIDNLLPLGKIDPRILQEFFCHLPTDKSVIIGPGIGKDAAVIDPGDKLVAVKTDPITLTSRNLGWHAVNINANDIACTGAIPRWFLINLLLPPQKKQSFLQQFFQELSQSCQELGIYLVGGHTEVTSSVTKPIVIGCMIGKIQEKKIINNSNAKPGDLVLLTKGLAIEGTHIIYREKEKELKKEIFFPTLEKVKNFLKDPGISVVKEATIASTNVDVHCMHDPTEGGLMAGVWEIATASKVGIQIKEKAIPIFEETKLICHKYKLDPLSLLASGALLVIISQKEAEKLLSLYKKAKIKCQKIGKVVGENEGISIIREKDVLSIPISFKDELNKLVR